LAIKDTLGFSADFNSSDFNIEAASAKITLGSKTVIVSSIYRPPSASVSYYNNMVNYMEKVVSSAYDTIFTGDFNLNVLGHDSDTDKISHLCSLLDLQQLVTKPTRVTPSSSTCIDLIMTSIPEKHIQTDTVPIALSDHYLIYTVLKFKLRDKSCRIITTRNLKNFNVNNFIENLMDSRAYQNF
jgi:hypothetical protein